MREGLLKERPAATVADTVKADKSLKARLVTRTVYRAQALCGGEGKIKELCGAEGRMGRLHLRTGDL